ncbi:MAG TPA: UvrD-helicase domain-containing protein [Nitrospirota bacterium]|nr:UvrD-helicase domain-containing protein [Nitrospirota bacterium]
MNADDAYSELNDAQRSAAGALQGPVLVVAGPGTGKTLTIVSRIARLIQNGVSPQSILAVTFTNRAAREMHERVTRRLGEAARGIFIGTFHLLGLRILRDRLSGEFTLLGRDEQLDLLQGMLKGTRKEAQQAGDRIARRKSSLDAEECSGSCPREFDDVYEAYQAALQQRNAVDFDDLIAIPIRLLEQDDDFARSYRARYQHIIVDEYQDINPAQYRLLRLLLNESGSLCAVGDADQAIYAFRGADPGNFLAFEQDFPRTRRVTLTHNYRSTGTILQAVHGVISRNPKRIEKQLTAVRERGERVAVHSLPDDRSEAETIIREIETRMGGTSHDQIRRNAAARDRGACSYRFSDFAVIFRTNAQARTLEEAFRASGIPYQLIGRAGRAQSREIEETTAFLRSILRGEGSPDPHEAADLEARLLSPADRFDPRAEAVALMTMHMAKGLEFRVVFVAGCEDGLVPCTIMKDCTDVEEERRLFYVAMTRARDELLLLHARSRFLYGKRLVQQPAPFLADIPDSLTEQHMQQERKAAQKDRQMGLFS